MRVASLLPSATEVVAALGAVDALVGRSHRCNHPESVRSAPVVTTSALAASSDAPPADIDAAIEDHRHGGGTYFRVVAETLENVSPDVLLTQSLCEVCAVPESMSVAAMRSLEPEPAVVSVDPRTIEGVFASIEQIGTAIDRQSAAAELVASLQDRIDALRTARPAPDRSPRVVCLEWTDPPRYHGLWVPELVDRLGGSPGFGRPGEPGGELDWADVIEYDPDVLIVSPCGRTLPEIRRDMNHLTDRPGWAALAAVANDRVYLLDGELSSRHGPRVIRAMELIATMLYPAAIDEVSPRPGEAVRFDRSAVSSVDTD